MALGIASVTIVFLQLSDSYRWQGTLLQRAPRPVLAQGPEAIRPANGGAGSQPAHYLVNPVPGSVIGTLEIPRIHLREAVLEGTTGAILEKAPGHLRNSVLPGEIGTDIIAAHNVTTFHHLDALKTGDWILVNTSAGMFQFQVTKFQVVKVGDPVPNTRYPSLVLETCYPLNAWYLTNQRFLVYAVLVKSGSG
jgi:sortase A